MSALLIVIGVLFLLILILAIIRNNQVNYYNDYDDEIVAHTTVTTTTTTNDAQPTGLNINGIPIVGMLQRQWENGQPFVIDPVDGDKMYLNTKDDLYEDGADKIWGLQ